VVSIGEKKLEKNCGRCVGQWTVGERFVGLLYDYEHLLKKRKGIGSAKLVPHWVLNRKLERNGDHWT